MNPPTGRVSDLVVYIVPKLIRMLIKDFSNFVDQFSRQEWFF